MNLRKIEKEEYASTLETLEKIFKEYGKEPIGSEIENLRESISKRELLDPEINLYSAFENGGQIGVLVEKNNTIYCIVVKKYAQKRGVGRELLNYYLKDLSDGTKVIVNADPEAQAFYLREGFTNDRRETFNEREYVVLNYKK